MKVLVTGGGGFLGCHIVELLQKRGISVRAIGRRKQPVLEARGVEFIRGDISFKDDIDEAVRGVDVVFHVAGRAKMDMNYSAYYNTHVIGTRNVVNACKQYGVQKLIFTSTPAVVFDGKDLSGADESLPYQPRYHWYYTQTKALAEKYVLDNNSPEFKTVALRPHLLLGEGDPHLMPKILKLVETGKLRIVGEGVNRVDITFVSNAAHAHLLAFDALESGKACGKAYFIGQEKPIVLWEFINAIFEKLGLPAIDRKISFRRAYYWGMLSETFHKFFFRRRPPIMTRALAVALSKDHYFSHDRAREDLGYMPQITIEEGLDELVHLLRLQMRMSGFGARSCSV
ncbi:MAG: NAD-dependent epimerase/dehydratase family protein [Puniceicoccales bacterium]|jgi:nucleoside-diphosphate-sugar epimerase|nr:NAD-dependent epimerase/dehydratase family protein [Puniceicoccales bacterium]